MSAPETNANKRDRQQYAHGTKHEQAYQHQFVRGFEMQVPDHGDRQCHNDDVHRDTC